MTERFDQRLKTSEYEGGRPFNRGNIINCVEHGFQLAKVAATLNSLADFEEGVPHGDLVNFGRLQSSKALEEAIDKMKLEVVEDLKKKSELVEFCLGHGSEDARIFRESVDSLVKTVEQQQSPQTTRIRVRQLLDDLI